MCEEQKEGADSKGTLLGHVLRLGVGMPTSHYIVIGLPVHRNVSLCSYMERAGNQTPGYCSVRCICFPSVPTSRFSAILALSLDRILLLCVSLDPPKLALWATGFWKTTPVSDFIPALYEYPFSLGHRSGFRRL